MINCSKCQYPNEDGSTVCAACGAALEQAPQPAPAEGQQPLDPAEMQRQMAQMQQQMAQMQQQTGQPPVDPAAATQQVAQAPVDPAAPAPEYQQPAMPAPGPVGQPMDPNQAQAEINQFLSEQKSRKRTRTFVTSAIVLALIGIAGFFWLQNARKEARVKEVFNFFTSFRGVDDEAVANFWKCTVRAKHRDIRLAKDTMEVTDGLTKAFSNFPTSQPSHIKDKCVPLIASILEELGKLKPPEGFVQALEGVTSSMKEVRTTFLTYAAKIDQRKGEATNEAAIRTMSNQFHMAHDNPDAAAQAMEYYSLLKCAIPDLDTQVKAIKKAPDTQIVVEYIYNTCKADPKYADKLRKECYELRKTVIDPKDKGYKEAVYQMAGDARDTQAIDHCFNETNKGFDYKELEAVAKVFIKYNNARGEILKSLAKVKAEMAD